MFWKVSKTQFARAILYSCALFLPYALWRMQEEYFNGMQFVLLSAFTMACIACTIALVKRYSASALRKAHTDLSVRERKAEEEEKG